MKARILYLIAAAVCLCSCGTAKKNVVDAAKYPNRAEMIVAQMHDPASKATGATIRRTPSLPSSPSSGWALT